MSLGGSSAYISEEGQQELSLTTIDSFVFENNLNVGIIQLNGILIL